MMLSNRVGREHPKSCVSTIGLQENMPTDHGLFNMAQESSQFSYDNYRR